jgi:hypothetical protein
VRDAESQLTFRVLGMRVDVRLWLTGCAWALGCAVPALSHAGVPLPIRYCSSNAECSNCSVCVDGRCGSPTQPLCRCDGECQLHGYGSCRLSHPGETRCGGECIQSPAASPQICGEGGDAWTLSANPSGIETTPSTVMLTGQAVQSEMTSWSPQDPPLTNYPNAPPAENPSAVGCSLGGGGSPRAWLWLLIPALALRRRR